MKEIGAPLIQLSDVSLSFSNFGFFRRSHFKALNKVSLAIYPGEILGIVGRNGCGKSTLLQVVADIIAPDSGCISKSGNLKSALLTLGLGFNKELTGKDNAILSLMLQGFSRWEALERLDVIRDFSELGDFFERPVKTYSSGMRSRLGFATALQAEVDLLLIDETLSVGDKTFNEKAESALVHKMSGLQTVLFVSHNATQVARLCQRALWLEKGEVVAEGATADVVQAYNAFMVALKKGNASYRDFWQD